jgi:beta-ribofuranosylaminobenzene 5'-phosphate synthase
VCVRIESAARLHMGFIDLHGGLGRKFGSIGVALEEPRLVVEAIPADRLTTEGPESERVLEFAKRFYARYTVREALSSSGPSAHLRVIETIPPHVGLGSGTQLALAVGTALSRLHGVEVDIFELARVMGRGRRSSIGFGAFQQGGFVVDGGHPVGSDTLSPVIIRRRLPADWRFVVVAPEVEPGLSGEEEDQAFVEMPRPPAEHAGQIARLLVMKMLPALEESDIVPFGEALTEIQRLVGDSFAPMQGGRYANIVSAQIIAYMLERGALGAGQSSWGPTVYALVQGEEAAMALEESLRQFPEGHPMTVYRSRVAREGARIIVRHQNGASEE